MSKRTQDITTSGTWAGLTNGLASLRHDVQQLRAALTSRQQVGLAIFAVILGIQVAVPLVQLAGDRPQRFGWQMFSGSGAQSEFEIVKTDGSILAVDTSNHIGYRRLEMDYADDLAGHLCSLDADTVAVHILHDNPAEDEVRACRR